MQEALAAQAKRLNATPVKVRRQDGSVAIESRLGERLERLPDEQVLIPSAKDPIAACVFPPHLYLGSQDAAENLSGLLDSEIGAILNVSFSDEAFPGRFNYQRLPLYDTEEQTLDLEPHLEFLRTNIEQKRNILVHCNQGVSRSTTVCLAYLMLDHGMSFDEALAQIKAARPSVRPNAGFVARLKLLEH
jgi:protein-tyrosine phosphatase